MKMGELSGIGRARRRVAVVGSGISGLATAWLLERGGAHSVTVFEAGAYAGGHTHTIDVSVDGATHPVDTGFLVFNRKSYPNLCALFELLGVKVVGSEMSFAVSLESPLLEWAGADLGTVFAQRANLFRPAVWRMLAEILRFNREATRMATSGALPEVSLGEYLEQGRYSTGFRDWYLLPMAAAIWSCPTGAMLAYPLATFVRFCHNHGLLQVNDRPQWLTVEGGGREYVQKILASLEDVRLETPIRQLVRDSAGVWLCTDEGRERFDEVVLACHSDQALQILGEGAQPQERNLLAAVRYQPNRAVVHTDAALLPRRRKVWSAWNYIAGEARPDGQPVSVSYLINRLQPLPFETPVVVTLNPCREPAADKVLAEFEYAHPVFDAAAIAAQAALGDIQGRAGVWFTGAWTGYGFHEDGLKSAIAVVEAMGVGVPWRNGAVAQQQAVVA